MPDLDDSAQLLYTPAEAARLLRVRESWLRRKAAAREIPFTFLGRHLRFSAADLAAIVAAARPAGVGRRGGEPATTGPGTATCHAGAGRRVDASDPMTPSPDGSSPWPG